MTHDEYNIRLRPIIDEVRALLQRTRTVLSQLEHMAPEPPNEDSLERLALNVRARSCLSYQGVNSIAQLREMSQVELLHLPNLGRGTLTQIKIALEEHDKAKAKP